jgi:hypothetical protein
MTYRAAGGGTPGVNRVFWRRIIGRRRVPTLRRRGRRAPRTRIVSLIYSIAVSACVSAFARVSRDAAIGRVLMPPSSGIIAKQ